MVAVETTCSVALRMPPKMIGSASGISTRVAIWDSVMPTPREASTVAGSTALTPAYVEVRIGGMARITSATMRRDQPGADQRDDQHQHAQRRQRPAGVAGVDRQERRPSGVADQHAEREREHERDHDRDHGVHQVLEGPVDEAVAARPVGGVEQEGEDAVVHRDASARAHGVSERCTMTMRKSATSASSTESTSPMKIGGM